jgi:hypothetical protein
MSIYEQALFSKKLRMREAPEWCEFLRLWAAFNCIYGESDNRFFERDRVMQTVQVHINDIDSLEVIDQTTEASARILDTPPADMRKDATDLNFRAQTQALARTYGDADRSGRERLSALLGVIYQVRCNLLHGDKDPDDERDMALVRDSIIVLKKLMPVLERSIIAPA